MTGELTEAKLAEGLALMTQRYILDRNAPDPTDPEVAAEYRNGRHFGVYDKETGKSAILPDATLCWGLDINRALDCLIELRGGRMAERA